MSTVQSVTGPVEARDLGVTLPHEHVFINMTRTTPADGYLNVWSDVESELGLFRAAGGTTIVDLTNGELSDHAAPVFWGNGEHDFAQNATTGSRSPANVLATKAMAEQTGLTVILGTGHYYQAYLDTEWWDRTSTNAIADHLIADLVEEIPGTGVRAGLLGEIASDLPYITAAEERSFRAAARAQRETGVLLSTHAPTFPTGLAQLEILTEEGVDLERVVVGHTDTVKSVDYSLALLAKGAYIQYDCMMTCRVGGALVLPEIERRIDFLRMVVDAGYADKVLLSHDVCQRSHMHSRGGAGFVFLFEEFIPRAIAAGIAPEVMQQIVTDNPRRALAGE
jgi:phosphotriesterase-related protein